MASELQENRRKGCVVVDKENHLVAGLNPAAVVFNVRLSDRFGNRLLRLRSAVRIRNGGRRLDYPRLQIRRGLVGFADLRRHRDIGLRQEQSKSAAGLRFTLENDFAAEQSSNLT